MSKIITMMLVFVGIAFSSIAHAAEVGSFCALQGATCEGNTRTLDLTNGKRDTIRFQTVVRNGWSSALPGHVEIQRGDNVDVVTIVGPHRKLSRKTIDGVEYRRFKGARGGIILVASNMTIIFEN